MTVPPAQRPRVVVTLSADNAQPWSDLFRAALPGADLRRREPDQAVREEEAAADYVVLAERCRTVFDAHPAPKAVFTASAGVGHLLRLPNLPREVPVFRLEDAGMALPMARYALAAALRFALRMDEFALQQGRSHWETRRTRTPDEIRVGVLGLGVIGGEIARMLERHGFAVRGYATTPKTIEGVDCRAGAGSFEAFMRGLDMIVNALPLTPATTGLLDGRALAFLADGAYVVNMGRGGTLVDADLLALLDSGKLSGATLDVFRKEPLPHEDPYWSHPKVTITPHVSGLTVPGDAVAQIAEKILRLERGQEVQGSVDWKRGY